MGMPLGDVTMLAEPEPVVEQLLAACEKRLGGKSKWDGQNNNGAVIPSHFFGPQKGRTFGARINASWD